MRWAAGAEASPAAVPPLLRRKRVTARVWAVHRQPPGRVLVLAAAVLVVVGALDWLSGQYYSFSVFYLLVVVLVGAMGREVYLAPTALLTAGTWAIIEGLGRRLDDPWLPLLWNGLARFAVLYVSALLVLTVVGTARQERELSRTDPLTGVLNRRGFAAAAEDELARARRSGSAPSALYLDIDGFKAVNDRQGHAAGDRLLAQVAATLRGTVRRHDVVARMGGDEFAALLPDTGSAAAGAAAERVTDQLDQMCRRERWPVRFSVGMAAFSEVPTSVDVLLAEGDRLMYAAKQDGRRSARSTVLSAVVPPAAPAP